jgi:hypothetical protein
VRLIASISSEKVGPSFSSKNSIDTQKTSVKMASLPPAMNFADEEEKICKKWQDEDTFKMQDKLGLERGDEVSEGVGETDCRPWSKRPPCLRIGSMFETICFLILANS